MQGNLRNRIILYERQRTEDDWGASSYGYKQTLQLRGEVKWESPDPRTLQQSEDLRQVARIVIRASHSIKYRDMLKVELQDGSWEYLEVVSVKHPVRGSRLYQEITGRAPAQEVNF